MREMRRYEIPVDDELHTITLSEACYWPQTFGVKDTPDGYVVEFWAEYDSAVPIRQVQYMIFGTGHFIGDTDYPTDRFVYIGTAPRHSSGLVWHVFEYTES